MMAIAGWMYFAHQTEWKAYLQDLVSYDDRALLKSIVIIDSMQTKLERRMQESTEDNNVGWTKQDAKDMGEIANKIRNGECLSEGELAKSRNKMKKYWRQLMMVSKKQQEQKYQQQLAAKAEAEQKAKANHIEQFKNHNKVLRECSENGKACEYGICDECPATKGLQMHLQLGGTNDQI